MPIVHVVQFGFKSTVTPEQIQDMSSRMLGLKDKCLHPTTKKPYIKYAYGGRQNSTEGFDGGITHVFLSEFENEEDRRYYVEEDPAHIEFKEAAIKVVEVLRVVDFEPGKF